MPKKRRIKCYWDLIEPYYEALELSKAPATVLRQLGSMPKPSANLLSAHLCQEEVLNGGFMQFFANSSGVLAPDAASAFRAMELVQWAEIVEGALRFFGPEYPRARKIRQSALPTRPPGKKAAEWDPFYGLDSQFYALLKADDAAWERAANEYASKSAA